MGAAAADIPRTTARSAPRSIDDIARALREAREYTLGLYAHLTDAEREFPRLPTVNPALWELGHLGWFQEFWCRRYRRDDPRGVTTSSRLRDADSFFDSGSVPHATRWDLRLPSLAGIHDYLAQTLDDTLSALQRSDGAHRYFFELALYHEDMHGEALLMTLQSLGLPAPSNVSRKPALFDESGDIAIPGGAIRLGSERNDDERRFVFDNEKFAHDVDVPAFRIARRCVTDVEFAEFVEAGGYMTPGLWSNEGRAWLRSAQRQAPAWWRRTSGGFEKRRFERWLPLAADEPVEHVNAFEAEAWCAWAGRRLPSEAEWEKAATSERLSGRGIAWEWTATPFAPYPGFVPDPYEAYSAPWFHDHRVLRGSSWATPPRLAHSKFRNFYRPERHDPFAGLRSCAQY
ncbi:MAG TPA: selenoneine synthase SenA [Casimicrobiaceae bacterium]|nr:selenoneine synthase SenA [Casimicrobiaceae bacterium]